MNQLQPDCPHLQELDALLESQTIMGVDLRVGPKISGRVPHLLF